MPHSVLTALRWGLPVLATVTLLGSIRMQFVPGVPLALLLVVAWVFVLPRPYYRGQ
jgi:hypothetical protein